MIGFVEALASSSGSRQRSDCARRVGLGEGMCGVRVARSTFRRSAGRSARVPRASKESESAEESAFVEPEDDPSKVHPSWFIYQRPGNLCVICYGEGHEKCLYCYGKGQIVVGTNPERDTKECPLCDGKGSSECNRCEGTGKRPDWRYDIQLRKRVPNKTNADVCKEMVFDASKYQVSREEESGETSEKSSTPTGESGPPAEEDTTAPLASAANETD